MFRIIFALLFLGTCSMSAQAVTIDPDNCVDGEGTSGAGLTCWYVNTISALNADAVESEVGTSTELILLYKSDWGGSDSGTFSEKYTTTFNGFEKTSPDDDPTGANIEHDTGFESIICPECYLVVKGGPAQYIIDIGFWGGVDTLALEGFWDAGPGSISHVAIFGGEAVPQIPVPAAIWLFGTALIGFVGMSRKTKV